MLEHEGVFTMHVLDGWKATRSEGTYELLPPNGEGAIHISATSECVRRLATRCRECSFSELPPGLPF
jgi:hypothetical protein